MWIQCISEKRAKYDNGEDPLDPEQQQQGNWGGNPFGQGFNPFGHGGGQGYNFKFHFNWAGRQWSICDIKCSLHPLLVTQRHLYDTDANAR